MNHSKKYIVVPYVKSIENPNDSLVNNYDQKMSEIINDSQLSDANKMKLYHQSLNKFLLKYDPETYGVTPTLVKLAKVVQDFIHTNDQHIVKDIKEPNNEDDDDNDDDDEESMNLQMNDSFLDSQNDKIKIHKSHNSPNDYDDKKNEFLNTAIYSANETPAKKRAMEDKYYSPETENILSNFEKEIQPAQNLRNKKAATHSKGIESTINRNAKTRIRNFLEIPNNTEKIIPDTKRAKIKQLIIQNKEKEETSAGSNDQRPSTTTTTPEFLSKQFF